MGIGANDGKTRKNRKCAVKYTDRIELEEETYQNNPFSKWIKFENNKSIIASIPFVRNLADFSGDQTTANNLTSLLHQKTNTSTITLKDLWDNYKIIVRQGINFSNAAVIVENLIYELADNICTDTSQKLELEDKVVLSMAIRLKAEKFMIDKISDSNFVSTVTKNQTYALAEKFKELFSADKKSIRILDKVNLMTPENIHINSFMYEPILDMSNEHLKKLYNEILSLLPPAA